MCICSHRQCVHVIENTIPAMRHCGDVMWFEVYSSIASQLSVPFMMACTSVVHPHHLDHVGELI